MRIWLKPDRMAQLQAHADRRHRARVNEQNAQFAAGKVGQAPRRRDQELVYTITTRGPPVRPEGVRADHRARRTPTARRCG